MSNRRKTKGERQRSRSDAVDPTPHFEIVSEGEGYALRFHPQNLPAPPFEYHADTVVVEVVAGVYQLWFVQVAPKSNLAISALALTIGREDVQRLSASLRSLEARLAIELPKFKNDSVVEPDLSQLSVDQLRKLPVSMALATVDGSRAMLDFHFVPIVSDDALRRALDFGQMPRVRNVVRIVASPLVMSHLMECIRTQLSRREA